MADRPIAHRWYAALYDRLARPQDERLTALRRTVAGGAAGRVLEVGCGTGLNFAHYDWSRVRNLEAAEPDPHMRLRAETRLRSLPAAQRERVRLTGARAESLPFPDQSFDNVVCTLVLCSVQDLEQSIRELRRVITASGELRLLEHVRANGFAAGVQQAVQPVYGWFSAGCRLNRDTKSALVAGGFEVEVLQWTAFGPLLPAFVAVARPIA